jgi:murein DD-endopeptidase MepM/ murein hydrolase activator NlpD
MYLERITDGPRIVPKGVSRTALDVLPNGRPSFRVTQGFYDKSAALGGAFHQAMDIGNYFTGDKLYAPFPGRLINRRDPNGALIVEIRASDGTLFGAAHLSRFAQTSGIMVGRGWLIGYVGNTGLSTSAHAHVWVERNGQLLDPWNQLVQSRRARLNGFPINIRNQPSTSGTIYATSQGSGIYTPKGVRIGPWDMPISSGWHWVRGGTHGIGAYPSDWRKLWLNGAYRYVARPLMTIL